MKRTGLPIGVALVLLTGCANAGRPQAGPSSTVTPSAGPLKTVTSGSLPAGAPSEVLVAVNDSVEVISSETGDRIRWLTKSSDDGHVIVRLSSDGVYVAQELTPYGHPDVRSEIIHIPMEGGEPESLVKTSGLISEFDVSPDELLLAYTVVFDPKYGSFLRDLTTGDESRIEGWSWSFSPDGHFLAGDGDEDESKGIVVLDLSTDLATPYAFYAPPESNRAWSNPIYRGATGELLVDEFECFDDGPEAACSGLSDFQVVLDAMSGEMLRRLDDRGQGRVLVFDVTGEHALYSVPPDPYWNGPDSLWRVNNDDHLVRLLPGYKDADW